MNSELRVLIVGGYGIFGGRLVELRLVPTLFDRASDDTTQLAALHAKVVVDASGPFQAYGSNSYRLIEQCISCSANYLGLADGSEFVAGIARFDAAARAAGIYVLSGVSTERHG